MAEPPSVETKSESLTIYYGQDCVPKAPMSEFLLKMDFTCAFQIGIDFSRVQFHDTFFFFWKIFWLSWNSLVLVLSSCWSLEMYKDPVPLFLPHGMGIAKKSL